MAEPIVWQNFNSENDITWILLRGRIGFRKGDLIVKGEGSTPVILAPKEPFVEWNRYEAVEIRMYAEGGKEIKVKVGNQEYKQKIASLRQYHDYRFDVRIDEPGIRPLAIMPTDGLLDLVAIQSIRIVPRKAEFPQAAGRQFLGKRDEYRNTLYVHSPSTVTFELQVPKSARLHFGMGITEKGSPVTFRVTADSKELYSKTVTDTDSWDDADADLSSYGGRSVKLAFETSAEKPGAVALWANPLLIMKVPRNRPNLLLYMIDTERADHSSAYGYTRDTTPFLKMLGAQGLVFEDCQVQATWTKPSTASLLTSLYSFSHGIIHDFDTIPKGATTLAEQLRAAGYVTASVVANPFAGHITGLQRGFDYVAEWAVVQRYRSDAEDRGTDSAAVNKILFPWLERHRDEPFFVYAHTTDPHAPYRPPGGFEERFANPAETPEFNRVYKSLGGKVKYGGGIVVTRAGCSQKGVNPDRFIQQAIDRYDGEILHNDWNLQQLADKLKQLGVLDNTLIVVVSDHGEEFWEHGWTAHGQSLYQELTHGVFVMWNPGLIQRARRISEPVQLIDVMPTVLDLLGLKIPDLLQGQSLAAFVKGETFRRRGPVMTSRYAHPDSKPGGIPENRIDTVALLDATWKLVYRANGKEVGLNKVELYDRRNDRGETKNIAASHPQEVDRMIMEIGKWTEAEKQIKSTLSRGPKATMDAKTLEQLRSLGYIGGSKP
ncbi:MAG: sulfatase-like hydrolase/transferase [Acidobacteriia bacterium]|nr:sulfatase-like hydrolase/transferase [Terriglobia bacterium]